MARSHNRSTPLSKLPNELLIKIFRDNSLSHSDLASLSLVSRQFLDRVRQDLYESIYVNLVEAPSGGSVPPWFTNTLRTWRLLRTVQDHPQLAALVQTIRFSRRDKDSSYQTHSGGTGGIPTTPRLAFLTFLRLAQNVRRLESTIFDSSRDLQDAWNEVGNCSTITALALESTNGLDLDSLFHQLPNLSHLGFAFLRDPILEIGAFKQLNSFDTQDPVADLNFTPFGSSNLPALRNLRMSLDTLIELSVSFDASEFPHLKKLGVRRGVRMARLSTVEKEENVNKFWDFVCSLPALETLSFDGSTYGTCEAELFNADLGLPVIRTLRSIRFEDNLSLDRISSMLEWPLMSTIQRVVFPLSKRVVNHAVRRRRIDAVSTMFEGTGIIVVLSD